jgi:RHS repeat-associated protein
MSGNLLLASGNLDEIYAQLGSSSTTSYLRDGLNSTVALTSGTGSISGSYSYDPYGNTTSSGSTTTSLQYTGRDNDGATGLYYNRARYYSPQLARFISEDPIGLGGGTNFYRYANGNPMSWTDPLGLQAWDPSLRPPSSVPGGPWTPAGPGQLPGDFYGPPKPSGPRDICRYVPDAKNGGPPGARKGYWKFKGPGQDWTRYSLEGEPIPPEAAHPGEPIEDPVAGPGWLLRIGFYLFIIFYSEPAQ